MKEIVCTMDSLNLISKMVDNVSQNPSMDESSSSTSAESSTTTDDSPTSDEGDMGKIDVSLLSNLLECQLEEGQPNAKWSETLHSWEQRNFSEKDREELVERFPYPTSPRKVYLLKDGESAAVPDILLSRVKITPLLAHTNSRSLRLMSETVPEAEYLLIDVFFAKLKQERFLENSIRWLICKKLLSPPSSCRRHKGSIHYNGVNILWHCVTCGGETDIPISLPPLFDSLKQFKTCDVLAVILHWACQSDLNIIRTDAGLNIKEIWQIWTKLQDLCTRSLRTYGYAAKSKKNLTYAATFDKCIIEGAVAQYGQFLIIAAFNRTSQFNHLQAVPLSDFGTIRMKNAMEKVVKVCGTPFHFVSDFVLFQPVIEKMYAGFFFLPNPGITNSENKGYHNLNILNYVHRIMTSNFQTISSATLDCSVLQAYLDELQWREQFGHHVSAAFWNILYVVAGQNIGKPSPVTHDSEVDPYFNQGNCNIGTVRDLDFYEPAMVEPSMNDVQPNDESDGDDVCEILDSSTDKATRLFDNIIVSDEHHFTIHLSDERTSPILDSIIREKSPSNIRKYQDGIIVVPGKIVKKDLKSTGMAVPLRPFNPAGEIRRDTPSLNPSQSSLANRVGPESMNARNETHVVPEMLRSILMTKLNSPNVVIDCNLILKAKSRPPASKVQDVTSTPTEMHGPNQMNGCLPAPGNNEKWNLNDAQRNVVHVPAGHANLTINNLLSLRTWPLILKLKGSLPSQEVNAERNLELFHKRLVNQGYFSSPIQWMVDHQLVHEHRACDFCGNDQFHLTTDQPTERADRYCWFCSNPDCSAKRPFRRLKFFTLFGFPICDILHLIYHWAAQTSLEDVRNKIQLNEYKIRYVYWAIQKRLSKALAKLKPTLGGKGFPVEIGIVRYDTYCIVGAFEKDSQLTRLEAISAPNTIDLPLIEGIVSEWLVPLCVVVTNTKYYSFDNGTLNFLYDRGSNEDLGVLKYLQTLVISLFARFNTLTLKLEMIQSFLDELQWRERFGLNPEPAFWNLFYQIAQDDGIDIGVRAMETCAFQPDQDSDSQGLCSVQDGSSTLLVDSDSCENGVSFPASSDSSLSLVISNLTSLRPDLHCPETEPENDDNVQIVNGCAEMDETTSSTSEVKDSSLPEIMTITSSSPFHVMEDTVELICEEEPPPELQQKQIVQHTAIPGITMLSEEDLLSDLEDNGIEVECINLNDSTEDETEGGNEADGGKKADGIKEPDDGKEPDDCKEMDQLKLPSDDEQVWDTRLLTIGWKSTQLLRPVLKNCVPATATLKKKSESPKNRKLSFCLDEYYYARKKPLFESFPERKYVFCCTICKLYLHSNIDVMTHCLTHTNEKSHDGIRRSWKPLSCPYCFAQTSSRREMDAHVDEVHESGSSLTCLICSMLLPSTIVLQNHMRINHSPSEMPFACTVCHFRSSLHFEILDHFKEVHRDEPHLMCPFCLKICSPRAKTDAVLFTQTYCQHLMKHLSGRQNCRCPSCSLAFLTPEEVTAHVLKDHLSFQKQEGVVPFKPRLFPVIIISIDRKPEDIRKAFGQSSSLTLVSKPARTIAEGSAIRHSGKPVHPFEQQQQQLTICANQNEAVEAIPSASTTSSSSSLCNIAAITRVSAQNSPARPPSQPVSSSPQLPTHTPDGRLLIKLKRMVDTTVTDMVGPAKRFKPDEDSTPTIQYKISKEFPCLECGSRIKKKHYYKLLVCNCNFSTHCAKAFVHHMMWQHGMMSKKRKKKKRRRPLQTLLTRSCSCSCGFAAVDGDVLALHLRHCKGVIKVLPSENLLSKAPRLERLDVASARPLPLPVPAEITHRTPPKHNAPVQMNPVMQAQYQYPTSTSVQKESEMKALMQQQQQLEYERQWIGQPQVSNMPMMQPNYVVASNNSLSPGSTYPSHPYPSALVIQKVIHPNVYSNCDNYMLPPPPSYHTAMRADYMPMVSYPKGPSLQPQLPQHIDPYRLPVPHRMMAPDAVSMNSLHMMHRMTSLGMHNQQQQTMMRPPQPINNNYNTRSILLNSIRPQGRYIMNQEPHPGFILPELPKLGAFQQQSMSNLKMEPKE